MAYDFSLRSPTPFSTSLSGSDEPDDEVLALFNTVEPVYETNAERMVRVRERLTKILTLQPRVFTPLDLSEMPTESRILAIFQSLQELTDFCPSNNQFCCSIAQTKYDQNRFTNIHPYDENLFHKEGFYFNGSPIAFLDSDQMFIATQSPVPSSLPYFLKIIEQENIKIVVTLSMLLERGELKGHNWWSDLQKKSETETLLEIDGQAVVKRELTLNGHRFTQFHYLKWPDGGVPHPELFVALLDYIKEAETLYSTPTSPLLVHCSAGIGRTGTFIVAKKLLDCPLDITKVPLIEEIFKARLCRSKMVQTIEQFKALIQIIRKKVLGVD